MSADSLFGGFVCSIVAFFVANDPNAKHKAGRLQKQHANFKKLTGVGISVGKAKQNNKKQLQNKCKNKLNLTKNSIVHK